MVIDASANRWVSIMCLMHIADYRSRNGHSCNILSTFLRLLEVVFAFVSKLLTFTTGSGNNEMVTATLMSCYHQKAVVQVVQPLSLRLFLIKPTGVRYEWWEQKKKKRIFEKNITGIYDFERHGKLKVTRLLPPLTAIYWPFSNQSLSVLNQ